MPSIASDAIAQAQLLLRFLQAADQMDEWRSTIKSLIGFAEAGGSQRAGPPRPPQATTTAHAAGRAEGATPTMQSPRGNQHGSHMIKHPTTFRWLYPILENVKANDES